MNTIAAHPFTVIAVYWLFSAIVGGMPAPEINSSPGYIWLHNSLHILAGNITSAVQAKFPELPANVGAVQHTQTDTVVSK